MRHTDLEIQYAELEDRKNQEISQLIARLTAAERVVDAARKLCGPLMIGSIEFEDSLSRLTKSVAAYDALQAKGDK